VINHRKVWLAAASTIAFCAILALCQTPLDPLADARHMMNSGKFAESETTLQHFLNAHPSDPEAHFLLGYVLFREQKARESLEEFTAGAKFRRPNAEDLKVVASDYVLLGDFADADKWFSEVVAETPNDSNANYLLGRTKFNENDFSGAIASFERALILRPRYIEAENNIGLAWRELNDLDKAKAAFQTAIDWQGDMPLDSQPYLNLGTLFADQNNLEAAIANLEKAAA
jgi:tetratricopeptide (TPR) repeat protein